MNDQDEHINEEADERKASDQIRKTKNNYYHPEVLIGILFWGYWAMLFSGKCSLQIQSRARRKKLKRPPAKKNSKNLYDELIRSSVAAGASEGDPRFTGTSSH